MTDDTVRCRETQQDTSNDSLNFERSDSCNADAHDMPDMSIEDKPEHTADDWMRIAEIQARNKACLPHLKSSYPLESRVRAPASICGFLLLWFYRNTGLSHISHIFSVFH